MNHPNTPAGVRAIGEYRDAAAPVDAELDNIETLISDGISELESAADEYRRYIDADGDARKLRLYLIASLESAQGCCEEALEALRSGK